MDQSFTNTNPSGCGTSSGFANLVPPTALGTSNINNQVFANLLGSIVGLSRAVNTTVDKITSLAKGAMCLPSIVSQLFLSPGALLTNMKTFLTNLLVSEVAQLANLITKQILGVISPALNTIGSIFSAINTVESTLITVTNLLDGLEQRFTDLANFHANNDNCAAIAANFSRCIQSKVCAALTAKVLQSINQGKPISSITNQIQTSFTASNSNIFQDYATKSIQQVNKATIQLNNINNQLPF